MITRKRGRVDEPQKAEVRSPTPPHTDTGDWVEAADQLHATSYVQSLPEGEDGSGLDLDELLCFDGLNWSIDEDALSPLFETGVPASLDADVLVKRNGMDPPCDSGEKPPSLNTTCTVQKPQKLEKILPGQINKNAIAARMNRLKKKEYVNGLEKKVGALVSENCSLKEENSSLMKRVEELEDETRYLRAVLANESMLAQLLSRLSGVNGMKLSTSLFQEADKNDHDYALPKKRVKVEEKETSGGVCLHVDKNHVSVEFCTKCAENASATFKM